MKAIVANDQNQIIALEKRMWNGTANEISRLEAEDYEVIKRLIATIEPMTKRPPKT